MFKKKYTFILAMLISLVLVFSGCSNSAVDNSKEDNSNATDTQKEVKSLYPLTITDGFNRQVEVEKEPMKVISLAPSITETIYAIGAGDKLVGRTDYDNYPEKVSGVSSVGSLSDPSIEEITKLDPDLIIASTHFKEDVLKKLEELGFKVVVLVPQESFDGVYDVINTTGKLLNNEKNAKEVIDGMKTKVTKVEELAKGLDPVDVYYVVGFGEYGDYTATGDTFINDLIEMAGGNNIAKDGEHWSYSLEKIVEKDPSILICSKYFDAKKGIEAANGYKDLTAVKNGKLFEIDNNQIDRQGPRLADGLVEMFKILHPGIYK
ncbi:ABC transporter substrate-binding protein [Helicovermis profundi]|uniref:ABC transporter substrate-binding protein n=1 Tax=Helicovermis profundi TaxID=3065157 RepID=A0AAU9E1M9_9FIRM|nr:ABC transporter substrate-binding protein [Clostridia bacterium S502]